ncbi:FUSC family protein [Rhodococcus sp. NPDC003348]
MAGTVDGPLRRTLRYLSITDPGHQRLRSGLITVTALGLAVAALVLHATVAELPLLCLGICTGVAVTVFVRTVVFPETPLREINSLLEALRAESRSGLDVIRRSAGSDGSAPSRTLDRIETTAMMIEDWIDRNDTRSCLGVESAEFSRAVFDAQVTTEEAFAFMASLWPRRGACVSRAADELADVLRPNPTAEHASDSLVRARAAAESVDADTEEGFAAQLAYRAVEAHATLGQLGRRTPVAPDTAREHRASRAEGGDSSVRSASDRAAVQVAVAVAATAAMVAGSLVNPGHWYWAVVTAFLVYTGTSTRGEVLARAGERVVGTIVVGSPRPVFRHRKGSGHCRGGGRHDSGPRRETGRGAGRGGAAHRGPDDASRRSVAWFERRLRETNRGAHALARAGAVTVPQQEPACGAGRALESVIRDVQGNIELVRRRNAGHRGGTTVRLDDAAVTGHVGRSGSADPDQCVATLLPPLIRINRSLVALVE